MHSQFLGVVSATLYISTVVAVPRLLPREFNSIPGSYFVDNNGLRAAAEAAPVWLFGRSWNRVSKSKLSKSSIRLILIMPICRNLVIRSRRSRQMASRIQGQLYRPVPIPAMIALIRVPIMAVSRPGTHFRIISPRSTVAMIILGVSSMISIMCEFINHEI